MTHEQLTLLRQRIWQAKNVPACSASINGVQAVLVEIDTLEAAMAELEGQKSRQGLDAGQDAGASQPNTESIAATHDQNLARLPIPNSLRKLSDEATAGEWKADEPYNADDMKVVVIGHGEDRGARFAEEAVGEIWSLNKTPEEFRANAAFIVAACNWVRSLAAVGDGKP